MGAHYTEETKSFNYHAIKVLENINMSISCVAAYGNSEVGGIVE